MVRLMDRLLAGDIEVLEGIAWEWHHYGQAIPRDTLLYAKVKLAYALLRLKTVLFPLLPAPETTARLDRLAQKWPHMFGEQEP